MLKKFGNHTVSQNVPKAFSHQMLYLYVKIFFKIQWLAHANMVLSFWAPYKVEHF